LRLKKNLGISSSEFLKTFTHRHDGPESGLPVVTIKPGAAPVLKCPFVSPQGCMVYDDRPASCRMYPVMRMAGRDRITGKVRTQYMLIHEPHCNGFSADNALTVDQWMEGQGFFLIIRQMMRFSSSGRKEGKVSGCIARRDR
jgi:uncharacterized protein